MDSSEQPDPDSAGPGDVARSGGEGEPAVAGDDPRDTSHPVGAEQARRNIDDEPAG